MGRDKGKHTIRSFQGLRALAFFGIFVFHFGHPEWSQLAMWGVSLFFLLSGFLTGVGAKAGAGPKQKGIPFMLRRMKKTYWLHIFMILLCFPVSDTLQSLQTDGVAKLPFWLAILATNVTLTKSLLPKYYFSFNGVSWFLSTYAVCCLATPLALRFLDRVLGDKKAKGYLISMIGLILLGFGYAFLISRTSLGVEYWTYICPIPHLFDYGLGLVAGFGFAAGAFSGGIQKGAGIGQAVCLCVIAVLIFGRQYPEWLVRSALWTLPNLLLIVLFYSEQGPLARLFGSGTAVFLGQHSANMFLIHQVIWRYYEKYGFVPTSEWAGWLILFAAYALTLLASMGYEKAKKSVTAQKA